MTAINSERFFPNKKNAKNGADIFIEVQVFTCEIVLISFFFVLFKASDNKYEIHFRS